MRSAVLCVSHAPAKLPARSRAHFLGATRATGATCCRAGLRAASAVRPPDRCPRRALQLLRRAHELGLGDAHALRDRPGQRRTRGLRMLGGRRRLPYSGHQSSSVRERCGLGAGVRIVLQPHARRGLPSDAAIPVRLANRLREAHEDSLDPAVRPSIVLKITDQCPNEAGPWCRATPDRPNECVKAFPCLLKRPARARSCTSMSTAHRAVSQHRSSRRTWRSALASAARVQADSLVGTATKTSASGASTTRPCALPTPRAPLTRHRSCSLWAGYSNASTLGLDKSLHPDQGCCPADPYVRRDVASTPR